MGRPNFSKAGTVLKFRIVSNELLALMPWVDKRNRHFGKILLISGYRYQPVGNDTLYILRLMY